MASIPEGASTKPQRPLRREPRKLQKPKILRTPTSFSTKRFFKHLSITPPIRKLCSAFKNHFDVDYHIPPAELMSHLVRSVIFNPIVAEQVIRAVQVSENFQRRLLIDQALRQRQLQETARVLGPRRQSFSAEGHRIQRRSVLRSRLPYHSLPEQAEPAYPVLSTLPLGTPAIPPAPTRLPPPIPELLKTQFAEHPGTDPVGNSVRQQGGALYIKAAPKSSDFAHIAITGADSDVQTDCGSSTFTVRSVYDPQTFDSNLQEIHRYLEQRRFKMENRKTADFLGVPKMLSRETQKTAQFQQKAIFQRLKQSGRENEMPAFEFLDFIGKGSFGRVYLARDLLKARDVAIKVIDADAVDYNAPHEAKDESIGNIHQEAKILSQLKGHRVQNVNYMYDVFVVHSQLWIVNEYCTGGSVRTLMHATNDRLEEKFLVVVAREMAKGLKSVHDANIMHRDIKAGNVMIDDKTGRVQLIDFGVAGLLDDAKTSRRSSIIGTPHWMAPEMHKHINRSGGGLEYGIEVDIWSYGCTIIEMATGQPPNFRTLPGRPLTSTLNRTPPRLTLRPGISQDLCDFVAFILAIKPTDRPSTEQILAHPFIYDTEQTYPTSILGELCQSYIAWKFSGGQRNSLISQFGAAAAEFPDDIKENDQDDFRFSMSWPADQPLPDFTINPGPEPNPKTPTAALTEPHETSLDNDRDQPSNYIPASGLIEHQAARGGRALAHVFDQSKPSYDEGLKQPSIDRPKSDLPLRNQHTGPSEIQRQEVDIDAMNTKTSSKILDLDAGLAEGGTAKGPNRMLQSILAKQARAKTGGFVESDDEDWAAKEAHDRYMKEQKRDTLAWNGFDDPEGDDWTSREVAVKQPKRDTMAWNGFEESATGTSGSPAMNAKGKRPATMDWNENYLNSDAIEKIAATAESSELNKAWSFDPSSEDEVTPVSAAPLTHPTLQHSKTGTVLARHQTLDLDALMGSPSEPSPFMPTEPQTPEEVSPLQVTEAEGKASDDVYNPMAFSTSPDHYPSDSITPYLNDRDIPDHNRENGGERDTINQNTQSGNLDHDIQCIQQTPGALQASRAASTSSANAPDLDTPFTPPSEAVLSGIADDEALEDEMRVLVTGWIAELGALGGAFSRAAEELEAEEVGEDGDNDNGES